MINVDIKNIKDIECNFNKHYINKDLDEYIMKCAKLMSSKEKLTININCKLEASEKLKISNLIHNYYNELLKEYHLIDKYDDYLRIILLLLGVIFILLSETFIDLLSELFLIAGWVVVWEIIYDLIFTGFKRKKTKTTYKKLSKCEISFSD